jgi:hypothetical protein
MQRTDFARQRFTFDNQHAATLEAAKRAVLLAGLTTAEAARGTGCSEDDLMDALEGTGYFENA